MEFEENRLQKYKKAVAHYVKELEFRHKVELQEKAAAKAIFEEKQIKEQEAEELRQLERDQQEMEREEQQKEREAEAAHRREVAAQEREQRQLLRSY